MLLFVQILVAILLILLAGLVACNTWHFISALRKSSGSDRFFTCLLFQASLLCSLFIFPFAVICRRWVGAGDADIMAAELAVLLVGFTLSLSYALLSRKGENG